MGCGGTKQASPPNANTTQVFPAPAVTKEPNYGKPKPGDEVVVDGKAATVLETTTSDIKLKYTDSSKEEWRDMEDVMPSKGKVAVPEATPGMEVTTKEGARGKITSRATMDLNITTDDGKEKTVDLDDVTLVQVAIERAGNLMNKDVMSQSDPYVTCELKGKPQTRVKTHMVSNSLNPEWNFEANILGYVPGDDLHFEVWDQDMIKDDYLGKYMLTSDKFDQKDGFSSEVQLLNKKGEVGQGTLFIRAKAINAPPRMEEVQEPKNGQAPPPVETENTQVKPGSGGLLGCC